MAMRLHGDHGAEMLMSSRLTSGTGLVKHVRDLGDGGLEAGDGVPRTHAACQLRHAFDALAESG